MVFCQIPPLLSFSLPVSSHLYNSLLKVIHTRPVSTQIFFLLSVAKLL